MMRKRKKRAVHIGFSVGGSANWRFGLSLSGKQGWNKSGGAGGRSPISSWKTSPVELWIKIFTKNQLPWLISGRRCPPCRRRF